MLTDELEAEEAAELEAASKALETAAPRDAGAAALWGREQELLEQMEQIAERARHAPEAKVRALVDWIRTNLCPDLAPLGRAKSGAPLSGTSAGCSSSPRTAKAPSATCDQMLDWAIERHRPR